MKKQQTSNYNDKSTQKTTKNQNTELGVETRSIICYTKFLAYFTGILAFATIVLAISTCFLWYYAGEQSKDMKQSIVAADGAAKAAQDSIILQKKAMINSQRAFLSIEEIFCTTNIYPDRNIARQFIITPQIRNHGKTPAVNVTVDVMTRYFDGSIQNDEIDTNVLPPFGTEKEKSIVGPNVIFGTAPIIISAEKAFSIFSKTERFFIKIIIKYNDWFDETPLRHTYYCAEVEIVADPRQTVPDTKTFNIFQFRIFGKDNKAD